MPIYEYRCESCGYEHEAIQKLSDPVLTDCPSCGKSALKKMISAAGFQLKGSGWYATDFKNSGSKASAAGGGDKPATETASSPEPGPGKKTHGCGSGGCGCAN